MMDLFITQHFTQDIHLWTGVNVDYLWITVMFYQLFVSHSDGTHSLQSIHWGASDVMLHFSKSDEETNSSTILDSLRVSTFQ